jgi:hypothetical protein
MSQKNTIRHTENHHLIERKRNAADNCSLVDISYFDIFATYLLLFLIIPPSCTMLATAPSALFLRVLIWSNEAKWGELSAWQTNKLPHHDLWTILQRLPKNAQTGSLHS